MAFGIRAWGGFATEISTERSGKEAVELGGAAVVGYGPARRHEQRPAIVPSPSGASGLPQCAKGGAADQRGQVL